ncbi:MAG TPA: glycosyltransferase family 39 protein [Blastocatellia bacterium]|nr:glycosyltransferase family 39 protein [Blastocatellia bacterium]
MINAGPAESLITLSGNTSSTSQLTVLKVFLVVAVASLVLRIFYSGHLYEDDGLWFTAAEEITRGRALYREIYFDKPPGIALVYAFLFWIFGAHVLTIRLFTIIHSIAISAILYLFGARLYDTRIGLLAAVMFAIFSTTYTTGHVQGFGTDFLMALPHTAGTYLLVHSRLLRKDGVRSGSQQAWLGLVGGALIGIAFQINPKGIFDLIFFALFLVIWGLWRSRLRTSEVTDFGPARGENEEGHSSIKLISLAIVGFVVGSAPFLMYVVATHSMREYWLYVWDWGMRYGSYNPASKVIASGVTRTIDYFALNNTFLIALVFVGATTVRWARDFFRNKKKLERDKDASIDHTNPFSDATLLLWLIVSYAGVILGGRLYSHYFFQILPALCLIGARGLTGISASLKKRDPALRQAITLIIIVGFVFTLIRFHGRTAILAVDFVRGRKSDMTEGWFHERIDHEERMVAAAVRDLADGENSVDRYGLEGMRAGGPRKRDVRGPEDYLFVWGYRPEIYYYSGLLPASRYLSTQPLTGVPADVHYFTDYRPILSDSETSQSRLQLLQDLQETRPKYIVDELGMFNSELSINSYPELGDFLEEYKATGPVERFMIYCRRDLLKKNLRKLKEQ